MTDWKAAPEKMMKKVADMEDIWSPERVARVIAENKSIDKRRNKMTNVEIAGQSKDTSTVKLYLKKDPRGDIDVIAQFGEDWVYILTFTQEGTFRRTGGMFNLPWVALDGCGRIKEDTE